MKIIKNAISRVTNAFNQKELITAASKLVKHIEDDDVAEQLMQRLKGVSERDRLFEEEKVKYQKLTEECIKLYNSSVERGRRIVQIIQIDEYIPGTNDNSVILKLIYGTHQLCVTKRVYGAKFSSHEMCAEVAYKLMYEQICIRGIHFMIETCKTLIRQRKTDEKIAYQKEQLELARAQERRQIQQTVAWNQHREKEFAAQHRLAILTGAVTVQTKVPDTRVTVLELPFRPDGWEYQRQQRASQMLKSTEQIEEERVQAEHRKRMKLRQQQNQEHEYAVMRQQQMRMQDQMRRSRNY